jgi:hypothetical protein
VARRECSTVGKVLVACPDARPPAYEAVAGLSEAGLLETFLTGFYYGGAGRFTALGRQWAPCHYRRWRRVLKRRHHPLVPAGRVQSDWGFDFALAAEARLARRAPAARRAVARWRTQRFDRLVARLIERHRPDFAFLFSDVASDYGLSTCREIGTISILSMVHGDVREERELLEREAERSPEFFSLYLADGPIDCQELNWLHERRLRDLALADRILVPSEHIAAAVVRHGTPRHSVRSFPMPPTAGGFVP